MIAKGGQGERWGHAFERQAMQKTCEERRRRGERAVMLKKVGEEELTSIKFLLPPRR